jgi:hypothetical protein
LNKIKIYGISIPICLVFVTFLINSSHAQSSDKFLTYTDDDQRFTDDDRKFTIQYPENWVLRDEGYPNNGGLPNTEVLFDISGTSKEDEIFTLASRWLMVNVEQVGSYLDTDTMTSKNHTLPGYCQALVYVINSDPSDTLIRQNQVTVGGNPGCRVEWKDGDSYNFEVYTILDGKLFKLIYTDYQLTVPETFPLANKMVESFKILK